ncbi:hypothetical protein VNO77_22406 [Canavalia gladiata]|uniref:Uncharacterized protein n=1 Tax=Canavalia gladiata TaxID=3824 RepID=A0AAN9L5S7_CANGL
MISSLCIIITSPVVTSELLVTSVIFPCYFCIYCLFSFLFSGLNKNSDLPSNLKKKEVLCFVHGFSSIIKMFNDK